MRKAASILVLSLILMIAGGLFLGGIIKVRQAAQRVQCINKLNGMGLTLNGSFHGAYDAYPRGTMPNQDLPAEKRLSWLFELDPWLNPRMGDTRKWHRAKAWDAEENSEIIRERVYSYTCASNPNERAPDGPALTHFVGMAGIGPDAAELPKQDPRAGVFGYDRQTSQGDIKNGLGTTMLVIETAWQNGPWAAGGPATVRGIDPDQRPSIGVGRPFGGTHAGMVLVLFADGTVREIGESIAPSVFEALATIAGGEEVAVPSQ